jgi:hypothetical protein
VKTADHQKRARRLHRDVARAVRSEAESLGVDSRDRARDVGRVGCGDRESIHTIAVARDLLKVVEVQPHLRIPARYLGRIGAALEDGGDDYRIRVAGLASRSPRNREAVADIEVRALSE